MNSPFAISKFQDNEALSTSKSQIRLEHGDAPVSPFPAIQSRTNIGLLQAWIQLSIQKSVLSFSSAAEDYHRYGSASCSSNPKLSGSSAFVEQVLKTYDCPFPDHKVENDIK